MLLVYICLAYLLASLLSELLGLFINELKFSLTAQKIAMNDEMITGIRDHETELLVHVEKP